MSSLDMRNLRVNQAQKFYNKHILYIDVGAIPKDALDLIIDKAIRNCVKELKAKKINIDNDYKFNLVCNKDNQSLGYAYLWVKDEKLYNICDGLNYDATELIKVIPDPHWKAKSPSTVSISSTNTNLSTPMSKVAISPGTNWAELDEDEEEGEAQPMITVGLPALITFDEYKYTPADIANLERIHKYNMNKKAFDLFQNRIAWPQGTNPDDQWKKYENLKINTVRDSYSDIEFYKAVIVALDNPDNDGTSEENFYNLFADTLEEVESRHELPTSHHIDISGAYVNNVDESEQKNVLTAKIMTNNIPNPDEIRKQFEIYATIQKNKFPTVSIIRTGNKGGFVNVTFDDKTRDAQFALYMTRKIYFATQNCLLLFNIAKKPTNQRR